jgi:hypothetical protein
MEQYTGSGSPPKQNRKELRNYMIVHLRALWHVLNDDGAMQWSKQKGQCWVKLNKM